MILLAIYVGGVFLVWAVLAVAFAVCLAHPQEGIQLGIALQQQGKTMPEAMEAAVWTGLLWPILLAGWFLKVEG